MAIHMEKWDVKYPQGIIDNILVKIGAFVFLVDFVVLDMKEDEDITMILGRPFLSTKRALVDIQELQVLFLFLYYSIVYMLVKLAKTH